MAADDAPTFKTQTVERLLKAHLAAATAAAIERADAAGTEDVFGGDGGGSGATDTSGAAAGARAKPPSLSVSATKLSAELLRLFTVEAVRRAAEYATSEGQSLVTPEHIEKILPQLLLDF